MSTVTLELDQDVVAILEQQHPAHRRSRPRDDHFRVQSPRSAIQCLLVKLKTEMDCLLAIGFFIGSELYKVEKVSSQTVELPLNVTASPILS